MDEEKTFEKNEGISQDTAKATDENSDDGLSVMEKANQVAERLEKANAEHRELLDRQERLYAEQKLSGSVGGKVKQEPPKEDTPEEYVQKVMNGEVGEKAQ